MQSLMRKAKVGPGNKLTPTGIWGAKEETKGESSRESIQEAEE